MSWTVPRVLEHAPPFRKGIPPTPPWFRGLSTKIPFRDETRSGRVTAYIHTMAHDTLEVRTHLRSLRRLLQGGVISDVHHQVFTLLVFATSVHADVVMRQPISLISRVHLLTHKSSGHPMTYSWNALIRALSPTVKPAVYCVHDQGEHMS